MPSGQDDVAWFRARFWHRVAPSLPAVTSTPLAAPANSRALLGSALGRQHGETDVGPHHRALHFLRDDGGVRRRHQLREVGLHEALALLGEMFRAGTNTCAPSTEVTYYCKSDSNMGVRNVLPR